MFSIKLTPEFLARRSPAIRDEDGCFLFAKAPLRLTIAVESPWVDELVYALYGLKPEEIKTVESAAK
jgi:hypothetical protein